MCRTEVDEVLVDRLLIDGLYGCWTYTRYLSPKGYARVNMNGRLTLLHRVMYEQFVAPIPEGLQLDHLCRVPSCVNPYHLEPVTSAENSLRSPLTNAGKKNCKHGHAMVAENVEIVKNGARGESRRCITCRRERNKASMVKRRMRFAEVVL